MAESLQSLESHYRIIHNPIYKINDNYGLVYLDKDTYELLFHSLFILRKEGEIDRRSFQIIKSIFYHHYKNSIKIKELDAKQPRIVAQKFIGRDKIRTFIFRRDGYKCLKCDTTDNLTIDHINPIIRGGDNILSNLQTLCKSCNSAKGATYKDYRNGAR